MEPVDIFINMPYGANTFPLQVLYNHVSNLPGGYITIGGQNATLQNHTKPSSLDYWLRDNYAMNNRINIRQTSNQLIEDIINTGLFTINRLPCHDTGRLCNSLIININNG